MSFTYHKELDDQRQLLVTVDVAEEKVKSEMRQVARKLGRNLNFPGFRKGKVPYHVIARRIGEEQLRGEAVDDLIQPAFITLIDELGEDEQPVAQIELQSFQKEPAQFSFVVPLEPEVALGGYRSFREEEEKAEVTEEEIQGELEAVQLKHQVVEAVERAAELMDIVTVAGDGTVEKGEEPFEGDDEENSGKDEVFFQEMAIDLLLDPEKIVFGADFVEQLVGLSADESKSFEINLPEEFPEDDFAGKKASFNITVTEVKRRELPAIDDDLARQEGDFEDLEAFTDTIEEGLLRQKEKEIEDARFENMMTHMLSDITLNYPPALLKAELNEMMENYKNQMKRYGWEWEDFLATVGKSEADYMEEWEETAKQRVERSLTLTQFVKEEKLRIKDAEIDTHLDKTFGYMEDETAKAEMKQFFKSDASGASMVMNDLLMGKVNERILAIATGNAPDLSLIEEEE